MNKKTVDKLIPRAIEKLNSFVKDGSIENKYQGYLAAFGPSVITAGLLQTVMFYSADKEKNKVIELMFGLIKDDLNSAQTSMEEMLTKDINYKSYAVKNKILEANIACKLAIRTFDLKE